jgi:iron(II)-dependent oxidoreductase
LWEWCHLNWFWARWCLTPSQQQTINIWPDADAVFNSAQLAHESRWQTSLPPWPHALNYGEHVLQLVEHNILQGTVDVYFIELALHHEAMHEENFFRRAQALGQPFRPTPSICLHAPQWLNIQCGTVVLGTESNRSFRFDNEKPTQIFDVKPFLIQSQPVSECAFSEFVSNGGYQNPSWWSEAGWQWRQQSEAQLPRYWRQHDKQFFCRELTQWRSLSHEQPMRYVNLFEAQAYATYAQARLPSAAEWVSASNVFTPYYLWEWTADIFKPYDGFTADAYQEYSAPSFLQTQELRGYSPLAHAGLCRATFRNFFAPQRRDICAGFRLCRDLAA